MDFEQIDKLCNTEFTNRLLANKHIFYEIYEACDSQFEKAQGSYLFDGQNYGYCYLMYKKQELLYHAAKSAHNVLEIGVYVGHSLLIMLLSNPTLKITCIDINDRYALPAVTVLNKHFPNAITFIHSDSVTALKKLQTKFDFFHVDGYHEDNYIANEFELLKARNSTPDNRMRIVFDDQGCLTTLQRNILANYKVLTHITPECPWNNTYFEIQL